MFHGTVLPLKGIDADRCAARPWPTRYNPTDRDMDESAINMARRKRRSSCDFRGGDAVEGLEPRLLPSAAVGPVAHRHDSGDLERMGRPPASQPGSHSSRSRGTIRPGAGATAPARASTPIDGARAYGY